MTQPTSFLTKARSVFYAIYLPISAVIIGLIFWPSLYKRSWAWAVGKRWNQQAVAALRVICGTNLKVTCHTTLPQGGVLLAVKHQSMFETLALAAILEKPVFVLKKEILDIPFFGWWCRACGFIGIDRKAGASAMRDMIAQADARIKEGHQVVIFPEGTRMPPGTPGNYHPGVAGLYRALDCPCVPVAHNSGLYWKNPGLIRLPGQITITFLAPIPPNLKRPVFMKEVKEKIETASLLLLPKQ